ncbi:hypothetical protein [Bacillus ndiopicus]|uniref:hypothetical protein n=1 Tax=Bacillus ndiopicus TaxID=1347368 RepID=UPI0005AB17AA|nr:hypothetical protein [Bacillus ndiopicus]
MKNKRFILVISFGFVVLILGIGLYVYYSEPTYSAKDVLKGVDFSVEESSVELIKIESGVEEEKALITFELTDATQQELIKAFEKSKFKKGNSPTTPSDDYWMKITLNTGYVIIIDMANKELSVDDNRGSYEGYSFEDDKFISILEKVITEYKNYR